MNIKYNRGASGLGGSLGGMDKAALSQGFEVIEPDAHAPLFHSGMGGDDSGVSYVGHPREKGGVCGRPSGEER